MLFIVAALVSVVARIPSSVSWSGDNDGPSPTHDDLETFRETATLGKDKATTSYNYHQLRERVASNAERIQSLEQQLAARDEQINELLRAVREERKRPRTVNQTTEVAAAALEQITVPTLSEVAAAALEQSISTVPTTHRIYGEHLMPIMPEARRGKGSPEIFNIGTGCHKAGGTKGARGWGGITELWTMLIPYFSWANVDGSCAGCIDPAATNFNASANEDDGSCQYVVLGCTSSLATNYARQANIDDGSCAIPVRGCMSPLASNFDSNANVDGGCLHIITGCTSSSAVNYVSSANMDDDSCIERTASKTRRPYEDLLGDGPRRRPMPPTRPE